MKKLMFFLLLLGFAGSCTEKDPAPIVEPEIPDRINAYASNGIIRTLYISFEGRHIDIGYEKDEKDYEALSKKYNDLSFNSKIVHCSTRALGYDYTGIDVTCDRDVDADHPAGSSLNDLIQISITSFKEYIANGYKHVSPPVYENNKFPYGGMGGAVYLQIPE